MTATVVCEKCGEEWGIGDWPLCPHGRYGGKSGFAEMFDDVSFPTDMTFRSASEVDAAAKEHKLVERGGVDNKRWF